MSLVSRQFYSESCIAPLQVKIKHDEEFRFIEYDGDHRNYSSIASIKIFNMKNKLSQTFGYFIRHCNVQNITKLTLVKCAWNDKDCEIFKNSSFSKLRKLDLSFNQISDEGVHIICESDAMRNLNSLNLKSNRGINNYVKNRKCPITVTKLRKLKLHNNFISDYSSLFKELENLTFLKVYGNQNMNFDTLKSIIDYSKNLKTLNLSYINTLTDEVFQKIMDNENCSSLTNLNLSNTISNEGCLYLAHSMHLTNIVKLSLEMKKIVNQTCKILVSSNNMKHLTYLNLYGNLIEDSGLESIMENLKELTCLNLAENRITENGIRYLIHNGLGKLKQLNLYSSNYSAEVREEFYRTLKVDRVKYFLTGVSFEGTESSEESVSVSDEESLIIPTDNTQKCEEIIRMVIPLPVLSSAQPVAIDLPIEIIQHIFTYLDWRTIISSISKLSHYWADEANRTSLNVEISSHNDLLIPSMNFNGSHYKIQQLEIRNIFVKSHSDFLSMPWITNKQILSKVKRLILSSCHIDGLMCEMLMKNIAQNSITELDLSNNMISDHGATLIFNRLANSFSLLEILNLSTNRIRHISDVQLKSEQESNLRVVNLANNKIRRLDFFGCFSFKRLEKLKLNSNDITQFDEIQQIESLTHLNLKLIKSFDSGICSRYFARANHPKLTTLKISSKIGDQGVSAIANCCSLQNLITLNLEMCNIGDKGCKSIAESTLFDKLQYLSLYGNQEISDQGLTSILDSSKLNQLIEMNIGSTGITEIGVNFILEHGIKNMKKVLLHDIPCKQKSIEKVKQSILKESIFISKKPCENDGSEEEQQESSESEEYNEESDYESYY